MNRRYEIREGDGTPILFVHGWLGSTESWKPVREHLELDNPLLFYDQSNFTSSPFSIEELADKLDETIEELDLENPIIVGHSLGGMTALSYASNYDNIGGLVLLGTSSSTPEPEIETFDFYLENLGSMPGEEWAEKISENYAGHLDNERLKQASKKELLEAEDGSLRYPLQAMKKFDVREEFEEWSKPAVVIAGEKDGAITLEKSRETSKMLDAEIVELDCGHLIPWEKPEQVADLIQEFVKEVK